MMKAYELTSLFQNDANLFFEVKDIREGYGLICTNLKFMNHIARLEIFFNESFCLSVNLYFAYKEVKEGLTGIRYRFNWSEKIRKEANIPTEWRAVYDEDAGYTDSVIYELEEKLGLDPIWDNEGYDTRLGGLSYICISCSPEHDPDREEVLKIMKESICLAESVIKNKPEDFLLIKYNSMVAREWDLRFMSEL